MNQTPFVNFSEIAFLSDRDMGTLLHWVDNNTWQVALYDCDPFVREHVFRQFSYVGWKSFEMDHKSLVPPTSASVQKAQSAILEVLNLLIEDLGLEDYPNTKVV